MIKHHFLFILLLLCMASLGYCDVAHLVHRASRVLTREIDGLQERAFCPENYSPCTCESTSNGLEVTCKDVKVSDIQEVFYRTTARDLYSVVLTTTKTNPAVIPAEILNGKRSKNIYLRCPDSSPKLQLTIDNSAFRLSRDYTERVEINNCDLRGADLLADSADDQTFEFLKDFAYLKDLTIQDSVGLTRLGTLPSLVALLNLTVVRTTGMVKESDGTALEFPILTNARITRLTLSGCELTNIAADAILSAVFRSTSASSLTYLSMSNNAMTAIPGQIPSFAKLTDLDLTGNTIKTVMAGALSFTASVKTIFLNGVGIEEIKPNAFSGDFTSAQIHLGGNKLTEFRADVFQEALRQMSVQPPATSGAFIDVTKNSFACDCKLAWLIRDSAQRAYVKNGMCCEFLRFEDLVAASFNECPPYKREGDKI